jgi:hypothetical protein
MDREDLENELKAQLQSATNSNQFPSARITTLIQNAYRRATSLFIWRALTKAVTTSTKAKTEGDDESYYDYPEEFRTGTIYLIKIDGRYYDRKSYQSFIKYREDNSNSSDRIFAIDQRFIFVSPDTGNGVDNMDIWGAFEAPELSLATSETIFSHNMEEANLALVRLGLSAAVKKSNPRLSQSEESGAIVTLGKINNDEWDQYSKDQPLDTPLLNVPDFFSNGLNGSSLIGRFNWPGGVL